MKKRIAKIGALLACAVLAFSSPMLTHAEEGYTYNYDWWGDVQYSPDAYQVVDVYTAVDLGLDQNFMGPQSLFAVGNDLYICDSGNNRIIQLTRENSDKFELVRVIDSFTGGEEPNTFSNPTDVSVTEEGDIFVADQSNGRIVKMDKDLNFLMSFTKPTDSTFDQSLSFLPNKLAVDTAGRVYCIAVNINQGLIKFENDGTFSGFVGATKVTYDWMDYIWKKLATKEQRAKMASFVPTEYDNVYMDNEGFIYACTMNVSEADLLADKALPVRRLNLMGDDILVRNGNYSVIGDVEWGKGGGYEGPSLFTDLTAMENEIYFCLDKTRGRIFGYDDQGRLIYAFGGIANIDGYFKQPVSIEHIGHDLIVLDSLDNSITVFTPTEFGNQIYRAIEEFQNGQYTTSGESWKKVMEYNGNYDLAYIGIGRALLRQKNYKEALDYFELKWDTENYSKAFKEYRKEWVEEHIVILVIVVFGVLCIPLLIGKIKKIKWEIDTADIFRYDYLNNNKNKSKE